MQTDGKVTERWVDKNRVILKKEFTTKQKKGGKICHEEERERERE